MARIDGARSVNAMFVETVRSSRDDWDLWNDRLRMLDDPPEALIAAIAWQETDDSVTAVNVWDTAEAVADFYLERVGPLIQAGGKPPSQPMRHGEPVAFYIRAPQPT
jgi:hypothetical protein